MFGNVNLLEARGSSAEDAGLWACASASREMAKREWRDIMSKLSVFDDKKFLVGEWDDGEIKLRATEKGEPKRAVCEGFDTEIGEPQALYKFYLWRQATQQPKRPSDYKC
jgi:hypothetical protein